MIIIITIISLVITKYINKTKTQGDGKIRGWQNKRARTA